MVASKKKKRSTPGFPWVVLHNRDWTVLLQNFSALAVNFWYLWVICHHFFSPGIKLNELGLGLGLVTTFFFNLFIGWPFLQY